MNDVVLRIEGRVGRITLNRPKALNALSHQMCMDLEAAMRIWETNTDVDLVLIDGAGERAFCAGGDIVDIYNDGKDGKSDRASQFWKDEYRLNAYIDGYSKPYVAIMDGIVMGGGVGVSSHGSHRIVTERTMLAMPECAIGLIPDVGGTYLLSNMPGYCGEYVGLTGARLAASDCIYSGMADSYVPSEKLESLKKALIETGDVNVIAEFMQTPDESNLARAQQDIDAIFGQDNVAEIAAYLQSVQSDFMQSAAKGFSFGAPLALATTFEAIRAARLDGTLVGALRNEFRIVNVAVTKGELIEGIRAALIDKDRQPKWKYASLTEVPRELVEMLYLPADGGDFEYN